MANIVFLGTPQYAVPAMRALMEAGHDISLLLCQPDKRQGRGHAIRPPATKIYALENRIEVHQPPHFTDSRVIDCLKRRNADFFVVVAYGKILPKAVLRIPKYGCVNAHGSLLPKWRGASPIQYTLLAGENVAGVSTILMDEGMDTGDVLLSGRIPVDDDIMVGQLSEKLSIMSARLLVQTIAQFQTLAPCRQNHDAATYAPLILKKDSIVDWNRSADEIYNRYRALTPQPGIYTVFRRKRLGLKSLRPDFGIRSGDAPGTIISIGSDAIAVRAKKGGIRIFVCQPENRKIISAREFANGYRAQHGERME